jgi:hypothetical protein
MGGEGQSAVPALVKMATTPNPAKQQLAMRTLGQIGPDARSALWALRIFAEFGEGDLQAAALEAIDEIDPEHARPKPPIRYQSGPPAVGWER